MIQEDKAKRYDEAIEKAKEWYSDAQIGIGFKANLEKLFPELKGNDDERIREALIALLKFGLEDGSAIAPGFNETKEQALTWLEKQGEPNPYSGVSFKYNGHIWGMCARDNGVEILVDGEIKERVFLDNKPQGKSALEAIRD